MLIVSPDGCGFRTPARESAAASTESGLDLPQRKHPGGPIERRFGNLMHWIWWGRIGFKRHTLTVDLSSILAGQDRSPATPETLDTVDRYCPSMYSL
jgi:hypothetical protein